MINCMIIYMILCIRKYVMKYIRIYMMICIRKYIRNYVILYNMNYMMGLKSQVFTIVCNTFYIKSNTYYIKCIT